MGNSLAMITITLALAVANTQAFTDLCSPGDRECQKWVRTHHIMSRSELSISSLGELVKTFLAKSHSGVSAEDIAETAQRVMDQVDALLGGMVVEDGAVSQVLDAALDKIDLDNSQMVTALKLWGVLVEQARNMELAGESPDTILAAIKHTAANIKNIVGKVLHLASPTRRSASRDVTKRGWHVSGGASTNGH